LVALYPHDYGYYFSWQRQAPEAEIALIKLKASLMVRATPTR